MPNGTSSSRKRLLLGSRMDLTVLDGKGQWRGSDGEIQKESTKVLVIFVPNDDEDAEELIEELSTEYKRRFDQEAVLKNVDHTCVAFQ